MGLATLREAALARPIDWPTIFGERLTYDREAKSRLQREAVDKLRRATDATLLSALSAIENAFPEPSFDAKGWPK